MVAQRVLGLILVVVLAAAACGGEEAAESGTSESTAAPPTQTTSAEPATTTTSTSAPTDTTQPPDLVRSEILEDEASRARLAALVEDLVSFEAALRWTEPHSVTGTDLGVWTDLTAQMAEEAGVVLDLEGDGNIPLANLVSLAPAAVCQWVSEGIALDDIRQTITVAASAYTSDRSSAVSLPGFSSSIAKNLVCPEYEPALTLQYAGAVEPVFTDAFDSERSGWPVQSYENGQLMYSSGFYRLVPDGSGSLLEGGPPDTYADVIIDAFVRPIRGTDADMGYGLTCRNNAARGDAYLFQLTPDGDFAVVRYSDNRLDVLSEGRSELINGGDSWNHLTAICLGTRLAFLVNGSLLTQVDDDTHTEGQTGLAAWGSGTDGADVVVDDYYLSIPHDEDLRVLDIMRDSP